jgi:hypothetical protein
MSNARTDREAFEKWRQSQGYAFASPEAAAASRIRAGNICASRILGSACIASLPAWACGASITAKTLPIG